MLLPSSRELAEEQGYAQVLWLDGVEKKYVEEVGSMNIMFKIDGKVYTAATVGTVLPGVTRRSCIELLKDWAMMSSRASWPLRISCRPPVRASWKRSSALVPPQSSPLSRSWSGRVSTLHWRWQDRPCDPEAVRHHDRDAVGQDPRYQAGSFRLRRSIDPSRASLCSEFLQTPLGGNAAGRRLPYHGFCLPIAFPPAQC